MERLGLGLGLGFVGQRGGGEIKVRILELSVTGIQFSGPIISFHLLF